MNKSDNKTAKKVKKVIKKKKIVKKKVKKEDSDTDNIKIELFDDNYAEKRDKMSKIMNFGKLSNTLLEGSVETKEEREEKVTESYNSLIEKLDLPFWHDLTEEKKDPFVKVYKNALEPSFCDHMIDIFEKREELKLDYGKGNTSREVELFKKGKTKEDIEGLICAKKTDEVNITRNKEILFQEDQFLNSALSNCFSKYNQDMLEYTGMICFKDLTDTGYQMQKYTKNKGRYFLHHDFLAHDINNVNQYRMVTFLFYLNDVEEGGETTFPSFKVKPEKGSVLFFPSTWNYVHSGNVPKSSDKYIITGWMYDKL